MTVYAIVPARSGSKGLPGKNIRPLGGKPLIVWTIEAARASRAIDRTVVSTDDGDIAGIARDAGADVPFIRPASLSSDDASTLDVLLHAASSLGCGDEDVLVLLQPTSPFRTASDIDSAVDLLEADADCVISVAVPDHPPQWLLELDDHARLSPLFPEDATKRRQDLRAAYMPNGAIYVFRAGALRSNKSEYMKGAVAYVMPRDRSIDIDTAFDFRIAECLLAHVGS